MPASPVQDWHTYAISESRLTWLGTFVTGTSRIGDGVSGLILSPRPKRASFWCDPDAGRPPHGSRADARLPYWSSLG